MEAAISHGRRLTIVLLAFLASDPAEAQSEDQLLREFSAPERASIQAACYTAGLLGPAQFYTCVARKADELRNSPGAPNLAEFSRDEQSSIRSACYTAGLLGPAASYACLRRKATDLRQSPGEPSLTEFSTSEQASIRGACYTAGLLGPASFYACLGRKADELRDVRRRLGLGAPTVAPEVSKSRPTAALPVTPPVQSPVTPPAQARPDTEASPPLPYQPNNPSTLTPFWQPENQRVSESIASASASASAPRTPAPPRKPENTPSANPIERIVRVPAESPTTVPSRQQVRPRRSAPPNTALREGDVTFGVICLIVVATVWAVRYLRRPGPEPPLAGATGTAAPQPPHETYRPRRTRPHGGIIFTDPRTDTLWSPQDTDLTDVRDAITGQPLRPALGLYRCMRCHVFYETASVECIQRENGGRCISCNSTSVLPIDGAPAGNQNANGDIDDITTLDNYRERVGQLVVFEGRCVRVRPSRSGTAYAVMFEHGTWTEGFKLVIRTGFVAHVGGADFIRSLAGRTVRARGVIAHSPVFGYEITITARSMILEVR